MPRVVISDTSPLRYLILVGVPDLLPALYQEVLIPEAVADELKQPSTPDSVRHWVAHRPTWLQIVPLTARPASVFLPDLDPGEHDAILLALHLKADLVLMDDREGVEDARRLGLSVIGTLGILDRAAEHGLIELAPTITRLRQTNFRIDPSLLDRLLAADARRRRKQP
jgi:predicted nucleic acid-binding protein